MKISLKNIDKKWKEYALAGCVCILFYALLTHINYWLSKIGLVFSVFKPAIIGAIIAYIIFPIAKKFDSLFKAKIQKDDKRWKISVILTFIIVIDLLVLILVMFVPNLVNSVISLVNNIGPYVAKLKTYLNTTNLPIVTEISNFIDNFTGSNGLLTKSLDVLTQNLNVLIRATSNFGTSALNGIISAVIASYLLMDYINISKQVTKLLTLTIKPLTYTRAKILFEKFNTIFSKYIVCELIDASIIGVANFIFMKALGMPDALIISAIMAITNLVPTFGPIVGAVFGGFILILENQSSVIPFLIFTIISQCADNYFIKPKLFGGVLNVPGAVILIGIIVLGNLMGVTGMLIAIPASAIIVYLYSEVLIPYLELKQELKKYKKEKIESKE